MGMTIVPSIHALDIDVTFREYKDNSDALNNAIIGTLENKASITYDNTADVYTIDNFLGYKDADGNSVKLQFTIGKEANSNGRYTLAAYDPTLDRKKLLDDQPATPYYKWVGGQIWINPDDPTDVVEFKDPAGDYAYTQFYLPLETNPNEDASIIFEPNCSYAIIGDVLDYKLLNPYFWIGIGLVGNRAYATKDGNKYNVYFQTGCPTNVVRAHGGVWPSSASMESFDAYICFSFDPNDLSQTGIEDIEAEDNNAPVEYYNMQGVRVENPTNGIYIRRQGNEVTKVAIN